MMKMLESLCLILTKALFNAKICNKIHKNFKYFYHIIPIMWQSTPHNTDYVAEIFLAFSKTSVQIIFGDEQNEFTRTSFR